MKALSLWQPWASLVISGHKPWETRAWSTDYRGPIAIHATKSVPSKVKDILRLRATPESVTLTELMRVLGYWDIRNMPMGCILGVVHLRRIVPAEKVIHVLPRHAHTGDFSLGRFAWDLRNPIRFKKPYPASGKQRLWEWEVPAQAVSNILRGQS